MSSFIVFILVGVFLLAVLAGFLIALLLFHRRKITSRASFSTPAEMPKSAEESGWNQLPADSPVDHSNALKHLKEE